MNGERRVEISGFRFAQRTNLIAGGNATESESIVSSDPDGVEVIKGGFFDPFRVGAHIDALTVGAAHGY